MSGSGRICGSSYIATTTTVALGRAILQAISKVPLPPATSITVSAPRPSVMERRTSAGSSSVGSTTASARPWASANSKRERSVSIITMAPGP